MDYQLNGEGNNKNRLWGLVVQDNRKQFTDNEKLVLYGQVKGFCPICGAKLIHDKQTGVYRNFEIAHIYPANATPSEKKLLENEERLSIDVNSLDNVMAVCSRCHTMFDNPRTVEEYREWISIKKRLINDDKYRTIYISFNIEEDIRKVLSKLSNGSNEKDLVPLNYDSLRIEQKTDTTIAFLTKKAIKNNVVEYYSFIKDQFKQIDVDTPGTFELIASQVKSTYLKFNQIDNNQETVFNKLVEWLDKKTGRISTRASEIIISYFIQDCEVFSNDTTK